jgi:hypothetical protein
MKNSSNYFNLIINYLFVGLLTSTLLFIIEFCLLRLNLCATEINCWSVVDDRLGGVLLVIGGTGR